nr:MFS transporter [uncultured Roseateles sp.]
MTAAIERGDQAMGLRSAALLFLSFAFAYFFSALLRAVTATLAPTFSAELELQSADLGLLAGAFFLGFSAMQLPLGSGLDRFGPKRVVLLLLSMAVLGCAAFALSTSFAGLVAARALCGVGVSACLMAPMTAFRRRFDARAQMRATSWMLMTGSLGMVASTLPVQYLLPLVGWRGLFWGLAALLLLAMLAIALIVPRDAPVKPHASEEGGLRAYAAVFRHPSFVRMLPLGLVQYGAMVAVQALWAGPWLTQVCGWTQGEAAQGLFFINLGMLVSFLSWGLVLPRLYAGGWTAQALLKRAMPVSTLVLLLTLLLGEQASAWAWGLFCVSSTVVAVSQPAVGQAFPDRLVGRALSAFNLVIFSGVFLVQWGIGLALDLMRSWGWTVLAAYRGAFALLALASVLSYLWFCWRSDEQKPVPAAPAGATAHN